MNTQTDRAKEIFLDALDIEPPDVRRAFLDRACGGDAALRCEVEDLLAHHPRVGSFLNARPTGLPETADQSAAEGPGTVIGPYKLLEQIGEGGFGVVFMAEQHQPVRRRVALKVLKPGMDTRRVVARFEAERQALALMDHPNIARVIDGGSTGSGRPFFVMELVRGVPVTEFCDHNHLGVRERLDLFVQVCRAVQHAHQKGVIHRDLKPGNVLVTLHDGVPVPKVIDFGIAKAVGQQLTDKTLFTGFAQMIGTPLYMSPEQAELSGLDVDTRADIYSLGVLLYELLTGTTPFDQERLRTAGLDEFRRIIREEEPAKPSTRVSTLGLAAATVSANRGCDPRGLSRVFRGELDWIVMRALEKDRNRRYETASAFAADVQRYLNDEPVQACPPTAGYRLRKFARRNRAGALAAAGVAAGLVLAVGGLSSALVVQAASTAEVKAEQKQTKAALDRETQTNDALTRALEREQRTLYFQRIALAEREVAAKNLARAEELLDSCPPALRGWEWHYLKRRCRQEPFTFRANPGWAFGVAISPDARTVATTSLWVGGSEVRVSDRATGRLLHRLPHRFGQIQGIAFSPDGKLLATSGEDKSLRVWDLATGRELRRAEDAEGVYCLAFSPDGKLLVSGTAPYALRVRDPSDLRELRVLRGHTGSLYAVAFGPGGRVVSGSFDGTVRVWDAERGQEVHTLRGHTGPVFGVAFSRDGRRVASTGLDGTARVWDARTGQQELVTPAETFPTTCVAFTPDGRRLAAGDMEKVVRVFDLTTGQEALALRGHPDLVMSVGFTPDGDQLVSTGLDGTVRVWDGTPLGAAPGPEERTLRGHTGAVACVAFRPGAGRGSVLASASQDGVVRLWDAATGDVLRTLAGHAGPVGLLSFSRDGRRLATVDYLGTIKVWDADTGREVRTFQGTVCRAALSPDGRHLAFTAEVGSVQVRDVDTGREVLVPFPAHLGPVMCLAFSPDGQRLATSGWDQTAKVWDAATGRRLLTFTGHRHNVGWVEFSDDGTRLATASWDGAAKLWDAATAEDLFTLSGHENNVASVAFSPDGARVATTCADNTVRVWDAASGKEIVLIRGHSGHVLSAAFSPDGRRLATASGYRGKGEVKVWDATQWEKKPDRK